MSIDGRGRAGRSRRSKRKPNKLYKVGYRKPPQQFQFQPGQSGNPAGRRKGSISIATSLARVLTSHVQVTINGRVKKLPRFEAMLWKLMDNALKGHHRSAETLIRLKHSMGPDASAIENLDINKMSEEQLIDFLARLESLDETPSNDIE